MPISTHLAAVQAAKRRRGQRLQRRLKTVNTSPLPGQPSNEERLASQAVAIKMMAQASKAAEASVPPKSHPVPVEDIYDRPESERHHKPQPMPRPGLLSHIARWLNLK